MLIEAYQQFWTWSSKVQGDLRGRKCSRRGTGSTTKPLGVGDDVYGFIQPAGPWWCWAGLQMGRVGEVEFGIGDKLPIRQQWGLTGIYSHGGNGKGAGCQQIAWYGFVFGNPVGVGEMAAEFAKVAEVWHRLRADVIFITFCSRALAWADDSAWLHGNALVFLSRGCSAKLVLWPDETLWLLWHVVEIFLVTFRPAPFRNSGF